MDALLTEGNSLENARRTDDGETVLGRHAAGLVSGAEQSRVYKPQSKGVYFYFLPRGIVEY